MATRKIGGNVFELEPMLAEASFDLQPRLGPVFLDLVGVISEIVATSEAGDLNDVQLLARNASRIGAIFGKLPPHELRLIRRELLGAPPGDGRPASCPSVKMDGIPLFTADGNPFDVKMQGRTMDTWLLLAFALEVHYPDFFAAIVGKFKAAVAQRSATSTTSAPAGGSGAS